VLGAGGPAGVNWCRALHDAGHQVIAVDAHEEHLAWCGPYAKELIHVPELHHGLIDSIGADVVHACPDGLVDWLTLNPVAAATLLPAREVVKRCQDKPAALAYWARVGLRRPAILIGPELPDWLHIAADRLGLPFWLRATRGAGARGATLVEDLRSAFHWIRYWDTRHVGWEWVAEEYLPGRDYSWTGLYRDGELVTSFARERLEYLYPGLSPSGLTGTPTIARVVCDQALNETAEEAVDAVDDRPQGIYAVDLREDMDGVPRPTEINPGRGGTTTGLWAIAGDVNFADLHARLAAGEEVEAPQRDALPEGLELRRHIDCGHVFVRAAVGVAG
jgi:carbamoyl-phosphate synthase large subunit